MNIILSNSSNEPIYQQIVSQIKAQIRSGVLKAGDALPSMRTLATQLRISVITTKRAYEDLERDGYIENFVGRGSFVKQQNAEFLREESYLLAQGHLERACECAKQSDISLSELISMLEIVYGGTDNE